MKKIPVIFFKKVSGVLWLLIIFSGLPAQAAVTRSKTASPAPASIKPVIVFNNPKAPAPKPTATSAPNSGSVPSGALVPVPQATSASSAPLAAVKGKWPSPRPTAPSKPTPPPPAPLPAAPAKLNFQSPPIKLKVGPQLQGFIKKHEYLDHDYAVNAKNPPDGYTSDPQANTGWLVTEDPSDVFRTVSLKVLDPVTKLYNPKTKRSLLTTSQREIDQLTSSKVGYKNLGVLGYVVNGAYVTPELIRAGYFSPLYRVAGPTGDTLYTTNLYDIQNRWEKPPYNYSIVGGPIGYVASTKGPNLWANGPMVTGDKTKEESVDGKYAYYRGQDKGGTYHWARYDKSSPRNVYVYPLGKGPTQVACGNTFCFKD